MEELSKDHLLVVDDEESIRKVVESVFTPRGYRVSGAANGFEALKILENQKVDIILLDLKMTGMDGMELLGRIRDFSREIPVVIITGHADIASATLALKSGASDFVPKPFGAQDIFHPVSRLLELQKGRKDNQKVLPEFAFTVAATIPSRTDYINGVIHYLMVNLADMNLCEPIHLANMNIALYEALANAILHGNHGVESKKVWVTAEIGYNEAKFIIRDEGDGFVPDDTANPTDSKNLYKASGRGIHLMKHFMDEVTYNGIGNEVTLVKKRCPSPAATGNPG